eukprot:6211770-Pleurochrysis_carterae.AAC.2
MALAKHNHSGHQSQIRRMKSGHQKLDQRTHLSACDFNYWVEGMNDKDNGSKALAYCARKMHQNPALPFGCRRAFKRFGSKEELAGFCNADLQKNCFFPKSFVCECTPDRFSRPGMWKRCSCPNEAFQASVDKEVEEKRRAKRQRIRESHAAATRSAGAPDVVHTTSACNSGPYVLSPFIGAGCVWTAGLLLAAAARADSACANVCGGAARGLCMPALSVSFSLSLSVSR